MTTAAYSIKGGDYESGGAASRSLKEQLKRLGADPAVVRRAMIAAYEAEMNVVIHAFRGELRTSIDDGRLDVEIVDEGPGIPDIDQALREGFSTAPPTARELGFGAGMGLPNIKKNSDRFSIASNVGQGTRIAFSIVLRPQSLYGSGRHSLRTSAEKCRECLRCLRECPTRAIRVFRGRPQILDYLCVDCTACIAACLNGALAAVGEDAAFKPAESAMLVMPAECLAQFGAGVSPRRVLSELAAMGLRGVRLLTPWEAALRTAVIQYASEEAKALPVISPACPAVVNLIETRFPSLIPHLAPFLSAVEAAQAQLGAKESIFVALCPAQRTVLSGGDGASKPSVILPAVLRAALMPQVVASVEAARRERTGVTRADRNQADEDLLRVTGLTHVVDALEAIENGLLPDVPAVELFVCDEGCFGSPLLAEDPFIARQRWETARVEQDVPASAVRRTAPCTPRPGLRLDNDMAKAIAKLAKIDKLARSLPGSNCALCGAPTCAALAEDIVLGRAPLDACVRLAEGQEKTP